MAKSRKTKSAGKVRGRVSSALGWDGRKALKADYDQSVWDHMADRGNELPVVKEFQ